MNKPQSVSELLALAHESYGMAEAARGHGATLMAESYEQTARELWERARALEHGE